MIDSKDEQQSQSNKKSSENHAELGQNESNPQIRESKAEARQGNGISNFHEGQLLDPRKTSPPEDKKEEASSEITNDKVPETKAESEADPKGQSILKNIASSLSDGKSTKSGQSVDSVVRLFSEAAAQSKKSSYTVFRQWEEARANKINLHRAICEKVLQTINQRITLSIEGIETVTKFFRERQRQEEIYYNTMIEKIPPLGVLFADKSEDTQKRLVPLIMKKSEQYHHQLCKNSQEISVFIQNTILRSLLEDIQKDFTKKLQVYKDQVNDCRKKMVATDEKLSKKTHKYWNFFTEIMVTAADKKIKQAKDLHNKELSILNYSHLQVQAHRIFGAAVITLLNELKKLESIRLEAVKQSFSFYMNKMSKLYGETGLASEIVKSLEQLWTKNEVETMFAISAMLSPEENIQIQKVLRLKDGAQLTEDVVSNFIQALENEIPASKPLVQKEWSVLKESGLMKSLKPYKVIITIEDNILLVDTSDGKEFKKADLTIKLENVNISSNDTAKKKKNPLFIEIEESKPGFLLDSKNKYVFKFNNQDEMDEFCQFLQNFKKGKSVQT